MSQCTDNLKTPETVNQSPSLPKENFVRSMTFANNGGGASSRASCSCDECNPALLEYINQYRKRTRASTFSFANIKQRRVLRKREFDSSSARELLMYEYSMPVKALPLIEYASTERLVWVKKMHKGNVIKNLGGGVMGSNEEEKKRKPTDWKEGDVIYVGANGNQSIGWVNCLRGESLDDDIGLMESFPTNDPKRTKKHIKP